MTTGTCAMPPLRGAGGLSKRGLLPIFHVPVVDVHGAGPHAERHGSAALLCDKVGLVVGVVDVFLELVNDGVRNVVFVELFQAAHEVGVGQDALGLHSSGEKQGWHNAQLTMELSTLRPPTLIIFQACSTHGCLPYPNRPFPLSGCTRLPWLCGPALEALQSS